MKFKRSCFRCLYPKFQVTSVQFQHLLKLTTTTLFLGAIDAILGTGAVTNAQNLEALKTNRNSADSFNQITNVSQLRDVAPTDWAYEALRSLVERYGCIAGFPDGAYRGNQPLSRYEFAAGLNSCLDRIERLIATSETLNREDLDTLSRLTQEFEAELATINVRVGSLEEKTAFLEDRQFSTTTKLTGSAVFGLASVLAGDDVDGEEIDRVPVLGSRSRLSFNTSFTGEDLLLTFLSTGNFPFFSDVTNTFEGQIGYSEDVDNQLKALTAAYFFPIGGHTQVAIEAAGGFVYDFVDTLNPLDAYDDSGSGAISFFGNRNPIYNSVAGSGIGIKTDLGSSVELSLGYLAPDAAEPTDGSGLFNGAYSALGQLVFQPSDRFKLGLTYINAYNNSDTFTGTNLANFRNFTATELGETAPVSSNSYGVGASWHISDRFILSGWSGYTHERVLSTLDNRIERGDREILNWAVTLAFPDLFKEASLGGVVVGMEPKVIDSTVNIAGFDSEDRDTSLHVEAFYQYRVNDNIAITPGVIWITAPDANEDNNDIVIGTLRTTFTF
ncbi:iron uptake porin [Myxosarcina sp. GI1]|uniref:iron uptake porin n=1 Tax=Myxosarcina sp. GI1 TaxID=1541065 RepID=UPI0009078598|nr:iron uptake porin [Myxosarcina sp. GI1]